MKKFLFSGIILFIFLISSCIDRDLPLINGMWQLHTIQDENNRIEMVDTIFYAFQRQALFSYTIIDEEVGRSDQIYGYIDFPDNDHLHILLDERFHDCCRPAIWEVNGKRQIAITYAIVRLDSKHLTLSHDKKTYHFTKF